MNMPAFAVLFKQLAPRLLQVRRSTWMAIGLALFTLIIVLIWLAISLSGWLWGQAKSLSEGVPETARLIASQAEQVVPGAREAIGSLVPTLKTEAPPRDVSGMDIGPVSRYPGLARSHWHRDGQEITMRYEGRADYHAVLDYYAKSFAAQGYVQRVISATPAEEAHEYLKDNDRVRFMIAQLPQGKIKATLIAIMP
jgi:hypothetical protein